MGGTAWRNEHVYAQFDKLIQRTEKWLAGKTSPVQQFNTQVIEARLIQRVVELSFYPFCFSCTEENKNGHAPFDWIKGNIHLGGLVFDTGTGRVGITTALFFRSIVFFVVEWTRILWAIITGFFDAGKVPGAATLVTGIGSDAFTFQGSDAQFLDFCKNGPVQPLAEAGRLLIQTGQNGKSGQGFVQYTREAVHTLTRDAELGFIGRIKMLAMHFTVPFSWILAVFHCRLMVVLAKDFAYMPSVFLLDKYGCIQNIVITNSDFFRQPLWMRDRKKKNFRVHEVHYSQNTIPFVYKEELFTTYFPPFRHVSVDEHWVWTEGYKQHLRTLGHKGPVHVVGPVVWYLPKPVLPDSMNKKEASVSVFDVTPVYKAITDKMGIINCYYETDAMIKFMDDIVAACAELTLTTGQNIRVSLKSKRGSAGIHDQRYIDHIKLLQTEKGLEIVDHAANIFSLLDDTGLSVSIPYTSVPYVSAYLKKAAVYYDPGGELVFTNESSPYIQTASGKEELKRIIENQLISHYHNHTI